MKENWERGETPPEPEPHIIRELAAAALPELRHCTPRRTGAGLSNLVYKLDSGGRSYALRIYRQNAVVARKEASISRLLAGSLPVPRLLASDWSGSLYPAPWAIMEWMPGVLLADEFRSGSMDAKSEWHHAAGRTLAAIHDIRFQEAGFLDGELAVSEPLALNGEGWRQFIAHCLEAAAGSLLGTEATRRLDHFGVSFSPLLDLHAMLPVLVHSDYNALNVLGVRTGGRRELSAVLDWEFAYAGSAMADIGNWLRYEPRGTAAEEAFAAGYRSGGGFLPERWRELSLLEDMVALCDLLSRSGEHAPIRTADLRRLIGFTMDRAEEGRQNVI
ncbi:phosphotransferase family protein [Paenibacillus sp. P22]|uniref:phosphotransferase family protein n=1 Tax=Paenibacillus sp. P22 TaxID=483908 RepID=UPI0004171E15|nr:phosphotransferase [Paenibacillus sp. P22]CDN43792.1 Aminoglycoside phosphotransferase [Paenibacillus sp. P22]